MDYFAVISRLAAAAADDALPIPDAEKRRILSKYMRRSWRITGNDGAVAKQRQRLAIDRMMAIAKSS